MPTRSKAYRLGKFLGGVNTLRRTRLHGPYGALEWLAAGGDTVYYFTEQLTWWVRPACGGGQACLRWTSAVGTVDAGGGSVRASALARVIQPIVHPPIWQRCSSSSVRAGTAAALRRATVRRPPPPPPRRRPPLSCSPSPVCRLVKAGLLPDRLAPRFSRVRCADTGWLVADGSCDWFCGLTD